MTSGYGVMDFSTLKKENQTSGTSEKLAGEVEVREDNLESLIQGSAEHLTFLFITSARVQGGAAFTDTIREALARFVGTIRLAIVDADQQPRVAAALRVQGLPAAMLLMKGQINPLFEGVVSKEQLDPVLESLAQLAADEGLHTEALVEQSDTKPLPAELEAAYDAMQSGDIESALKHFAARLETHPTDAEAKQGQAMAFLLERTRNADLQAGREAAAADPTNVEAQLHAADLDVLGGHIDDAFARLLTTYRDAAADNKDAIKTRLLDLFEVVGTGDERVTNARKRLSRLMF